MSLKIKRSKLCWSISTLSYVEAYLIFLSIVLIIPTIIALIAMEKKSYRYKQHKKLEEEIKQKNKDIQLYNELQIKKSKEKNTNTLKEISLDNLPDIKKPIPSPNRIL